MLFLAVGLLLAGTVPALARTARVPEDFSTIQAAVDYLVQFYAADTVLVQAGNYPERVVIHEAIRLQGVVAPGSAEPLTRIDALKVQPPSDGSTINVIGIHVAGPALTAPSSGPDNVNYESCRFDAGMDGYGYYPDLASVVMRHCTLFGRVVLCAVETVVDSCTVYGPLVHIAADAAVVTNNRFENVPGFAASIFADQRAYVARNVVRGGINGFDVRTGDQNDLLVEDNRVEGCAGIGIRVWHDWRNNSRVERNQVSRCGGTGIYAHGLALARGNRVLDCGGHGLDLVVLEDIGLVEGNVVGRCGGDGIRLARDYEGSPVGFHAQGNTVYACAGSGIVAVDLTDGSVSNNIAFRNRGYGLLTAGSDAAPASCNDWFENQAGATSGAPASPSDLAVDPRFCDIASDDVQLMSDSPLLDAPGCGLIGALGRGCDPAPTPIAFSLTPKTLNVASRGHWLTGYLEPTPPVAARDIDIATIRLSSTVPVDPSAPTALVDHDGDGITELMVRFDRTALELTLPEGDEVPVTATCKSGGTVFAGTDTVRVHRGRFVAPAAGEQMTSGSAVTVSWESPAGGHVLSIALMLSTDGGGTWSQVARSPSDNGSLAWAVPDIRTDRARLAVVSTSTDGANAEVADAVLAVSGALSIGATTDVGDRGEGPHVLAIRRVSPNPAAHGRLAVEFVLRDGSSARLELLDVAGRVLETQNVALPSPGARALEFLDAGALRPGIYFLRLRQSGTEARARVAITR
jgi:hypothetical protein